MYKYNLDNYYDGIPEEIKNMAPKEKERILKEEEQRSAEIKRNKAK